MKKNRTEIEINAETLKLIASGVSTPTRIMHLSNSNYMSNKRRLKQLSEKRFIRIVDPMAPRKKYCITEIGLSILENYCTLETMLSLSDD